MGMKPVDVLREGIRQRSSRIQTINETIEQHLTAICDLREEKHIKEGEIYEYQQALSQLSEESQNE